MLPVQVGEAVVAQVAAVQEDRGLPPDRRSAPAGSRAWSCPRPTDRRCRCADPRGRRTTRCQHARAGVVAERHVIEPERPDRLVERARRPAGPARPARSGSSVRMRSSEAQLAWPSMNRPKPLLSGPCMARMATSTATSDGIDSRPAITSNPPDDDHRDHAEAPGGLQADVAERLDARRRDAVARSSGGPWRCCCGSPALRPRTP